MTLGGLGDFSFSADKREGTQGAFVLEEWGGTAFCSVPSAPSELMSISNFSSGVLFAVFLVIHKDADRGASRQFFLLF